MIQILQEAALRGGEVLRSYFKKNLSIKSKTTHQNLVTEADIESQKVVQDYLKKEAVKELRVSENEIGFIGEEGLFKPAKTYNFAIDPLDGTSTFATGLEFFSIVIGLFIHGVLRYGVVYEPISNRLYYGEKNNGAFCKSEEGLKKLKIFPGDLKELFFSGGLGLKEEMRTKQSKIYSKLYSHFRGYISLYAGASSIMRVVENKLGVFFAGGPGVWDIAGAQVILEEAGGIMVDWNGKEFSYDLKNPSKIYPYFACHPENLQKILDIMK
jgi:myo-inositol-1(or 4)-monophosphatase